MKAVVIGTRGSALALAQTEQVSRALRAAHPGLQVEVRRISTRGDRITDRPLAELGRNGVFVSDIESALRDGSIDLAVHSAKDLPSRLAPDMRLAAFLAREDPRDVLVSRSGPLATLPRGARVGTSSPRRAAQLVAVRPDLTLADVRGNVDTRLRRLAAGEYDALVLAGAGLVRLDRAAEITEWLEPAVMIPAVGQGALAVEVRADAGAASELVAQLHDDTTGAAVSAERSFLAELGGDCTAVAGALAVGGPAGMLHITGMIGGEDGRLLVGEADGSASDPTLGAALARRLRAEERATVAH
jgi:hydroxymethylbilane synthase